MKVFCEGGTTQPEGAPHDLQCMHHHSEIIHVKWNICMDEEGVTFDVAESKVELNGVGSTLQCPSHSCKNLLEFTGMGPESAGTHRNGTGMELELTEMRPENQYIYISTCIQIDTTDTTASLDTFTLICTSAHCDFKDINTFL